ncbi:hypothetical protein LTR22_023938 [Elasticomyces elasticus]|nr:hypothetical protein LTR22_023938 [Elasticomyces elasticus]KAK4921139.1 hypothetical protein LTR49_011326 [Elasticomyces elasticus]KAK5761855.1 hypothetical protein LTS12_007918 [Elasticomyces elasticus]
MAEASQLLARLGPRGRHAIHSTPFELSFVTDVSYSQTAAISHTHNTLRQSPVFEIHRQVKMDLMTMLCLAERRNTSSEYNVLLAELHQNSLVALVDDLRPSALSFFPHTHPEQIPIQTKLNEQASINERPNSYFSNQNQTTYNPYGDDTPQEYDTREYQPNSSFPGRHYTSYDRPATRENHDRSYSPRDTSGRDQDRYTSSSSPYTSSSSRSGGSSYDRLAAAAAALRGGDRESDYTSRASTSTSRYGSSDDSPAFDYTPSSSSRDRYSSSRSERESTSSYTRRGSDMRNPFSSTDYGSSRGSDSYAFSPEEVGRSSGRGSSSRYAEESSPYTTREYAPSSSSRSGSSSRYAFSPDDIGRSSTSSSRRYGSGSGSRSGWRSGY